MNSPRLTRAATGLVAPPVRIVHIGVGAFHRAHQAWYTAHASDAADWGISAFTGRSGRAADDLHPQGGVYTLVRRGPERDGFEHIGSIVEAWPGADVDRLAQRVADPAVAVVTLTITEAGYRLRADGLLDITAPDVTADIFDLRAGNPSSLRTAPARLVHALARRTRADAGPVAVVPCDNLPDNGGLVRRALHSLAAAAGVADCLDGVSFVSTSVDRITPHTTSEDRDAVTAATGFRDEACVIAEPFADWTLQGEFPAGRPGWEAAGARFVAEIGPFEQRKLLLLNGAHIVLTFEGLLRGHRTIAEAMTDAGCRDALDAFWSEAIPAVGPAVDAAGYVAALEERFGNPRIEHLLRQIAVDTATKIRLRIGPVLAAARARGEEGRGSLDVMGAWRECVDRGILEVSPADVAAVERLRAPSTADSDSFGA